MPSCLLLRQRLRYFLSDVLSWICFQGLRRSWGRLREDIFPNFSSVPPVCLCCHVRRHRYVFPWHHLPCCNISRPEISGRKNNGRSFRMLTPAIRPKSRMKLSFSYVTSSFCNIIYTFAALEQMQYPYLADSCCLRPLKYRCNSGYNVKINTDKTKL